jgi:hypothetical protein
MIFAYLLDGRRVFDSSLFVSVTLDATFSSQSLSTFLQDIAGLSDTIQGWISRYSMLMQALANADKLQSLASKIPQAGVR